MKHALLTSTFALAFLCLSACTSSPVPISGESVQGTAAAPIRVGSHDDLPGVAFTPEQQAQIDQQSKCTLRTASLYLDGLSPNQPLGYCLEKGEDIPEQALRADPGFSTVKQPEWVRLSILKAGETKIISTFPELQAEYAPVDTPQEAYAFVLLQYDRTEQLTANRIKRAVSNAADNSYNGLRFETDFVDGTKIQQNADGSFSVLNVLFDAECNGGDAMTKAYAIDYRVQPTGEAEEIQRKHLYSRSCAVT